MPIRRKTLQELEQEYAPVMDNKVISAIVRYTPKNSGTEVSDEEIMERAERFAPEMHEIMRQLDDVLGVQND
jgi:ribonuclease D